MSRVIAIFAAATAFALACATTFATPIAPIPTASADHVTQAYYYARRVFAALCAHYPERYVALVEQPGPNPTATTFVDCSMADDSAVAHNSFSEFAAGERKATQESTSQRKGA